MGDVIISLHEHTTHFDCLLIAKRHRCLHASRVDSIEAMLADIPSRFSIQKSLSIGSPSSSSAPSSLGIGADPQAFVGPAAIPSRRSRDVPGLQPGVTPLNHPQGPPASHVKADAASNGEMPR